MKKFLFTLPLALLTFITTSNDLSAGLFKTGWNTSGGANQQAFAGIISGSDLINQGASTLASATESGFANFGHGGGTPTQLLNDGQNGGNTDANTNAGSVFDSDGVFTLTYNLNTAVNTFGYDLTTIRSFAAHEPSRSGQAYTVSVDFLSDGLGNFVSLGAFDGSAPGNAAGQGSTMMTLQNDTNSGTAAFASGVAAIRFTTAVPLNDASTVWREFDVFGAPTISAVPEPSSMLLTLAAGAFVYYRHRRSRKLAGAKSEAV